MNCRVYLVRHGETEWNAQMRFQGHTNTALSERGKQQAGSLARRLENVTFGGIYSSDLERAFQTAKIIAGPHNTGIVKEPAFREINFGSWEGLTFSEIKEKYAQEADSWWKKPFYTRVPGGESLQDVVNRCTGALYNICCRHAGKNVLVIAHGGVVRSTICSILGIDLNEYWRLKQNNMALNIIHLPEWNKGILELFNDCSHLNTYE